ncbi:hypothetical protein BXZ70DRAFT_1009438 [Cristinia sonorae]|uniref:ENTH domain-containing protein n=1 Tax=Cristinia sonorae TaxID=1940300 RepID=A0A8K0UK08_9AGAR|nr:hypothetical protein BXZ70DRAFT_1009438 [Cristinia sonorae]
MALLGKKSMRLAKNYTLGYSETQTKVRNATSSDPWPPSAKELEDITQLSYRQDDFIEIMEILDKRLGDKGKNWRHVLKSLVVAEHLLINGPETTMTYFKNNMHTIKTLCEFQQVDEKGRDYGAEIRTKARSVSSILSDPSTITQKRHARSIMLADNLMSILNRASESEEQPNENLARRDYSVHPLDEPQVDNTLPTRSETEESKAVEASITQFAPLLTDGKPEQFTTDLFDQPARVATKPTDVDLLRAIEASKQVAGAGRMTTEERDIARALELSLREIWQPPTHHDMTVSSSTSFSSGLMHTPGTSTSEPSNFDLLVDVSIPQTAFTPQLQFTPFASSSTSSIFQLPSSPSAQTYLSPDAVVAPPAQTSSLQPQASISLPFSGTAQSTLYGSNNPFANSTASLSPPISQTSSQTFPTPSFTSPTLNPPPTHSSSTSILTQPPLLHSQYAPQIFVQPPSNSLSPHLPSSSSLVATPAISRASSRSDLEAMFAAHTQGIDTFGNAGSLRFGATASSGMGVQVGYKSNNPFANLL